MSVATGAALELDGVNSALTDHTVNLQRANVTNLGTLKVGDGTAAITTQQVGGIDGATGSVIVQDHASLTANHIVQSALVIGSGSTFTLAPSDASGNPSAQLAAISSASPSTSLLANGSLNAGNFASLEAGSLIGAAASSGSAPSLGLGAVGMSAGANAVPEPSTVLLAGLGAIAIVALRRRKLAIWRI